MSTSQQSAQLNLFDKQTDFLSFSNQAAAVDPAINLLHFLKTNHELNQERDLKNLIVSLLDITLYASEASRSVLILRRGGELKVAGEKKILPAGKAALFSQPIKTLAGNFLPYTLLQYVEKEKSPVLINYCNKKNDFSTDPYFQNDTATSLFCIPLVGQEQLLGIIYLESWDRAFSFNPDKIKYLTILGLHAAVIIRNLALFTNVQLRNQKLRKRIGDLLKREQDADALFDNLNMGFFRCSSDEQGVILRANKTLAHFLGYEAPWKLLGKSDMLLFSEKILKDDLLQKVKTAGCINHYELILKKRGGESLCTTLAACAKYDATGNMMWMDGIIITADTGKHETLNNAFLQIIPKGFLEILGKKSIADLRIGDSKVKEMSILFADIRDFTRLSENMHPQENLLFLNSYLSQMQPAIAAHHGYIDKYMGDGIMALFPSSADDAVAGGIAMQEQLVRFNAERVRTNQEAIRIGIGINTGTIILGTIGVQDRMDGTVIGDSVNLASRLEELTKEYSTPLLISFYTFSQLKDPARYNIRFIDIVKVKGKNERVPVFEVFDNNEPEIRRKKIAMKTEFEQAISFYYYQNTEKACIMLEKYLAEFPEDNIAAIYRERCLQRTANVVSQK